MSTEEIKQPVWSVPDNPVGRVLIQRGLVKNVKTLTDGTLSIRVEVFGEDFSPDLIGEYIQITEYTE